MRGWWLAIDTAGDRASTALGVPPETTASAEVSGARRHAAEIVPMIDEVLMRAKVRTRELTGIVVGDGPGSFTGLRIGWAAARGLAHEHEIPVVAVPSLLAAAYGAAQRTKRDAVAAAFDALRGQVFGAVYRFGSEGVTTVVAPGVFTPEELSQQPGGAVSVAVGDGALKYAAAFRDWTGSEPLALNDVAPGAESLLTLVARDGVARRVEVRDEPVYGRPAEAQAKWEARHGRPLPDPTSRSG